MSLSSIYLSKGRYISKKKYYTTTLFTKKSLDLIVGAGFVTTFYFITKNQTFKVTKESIIYEKLQWTRQQTEFLKSTILEREEESIRGCAKPQQFIIAPPN